GNMPTCLPTLLILLYCTLPRPLPEASDGRELEEGHIRHLVQPKTMRNGVGPRQGGRRKFRRPRPRLSHKGPMPF
uniref:Apelin n=1 Tax=Ornithorhynchus anatinus TaxID=9258 RepID=A0A6I8PRH6_ORNAN